MPLPRGFKSRANTIAREVRRSLRLAAGAPLDPRAVADKLRMRILPLSAFATTNARSVRQLMTVDPGAFSACTIHDGGKRLIVVNDAHEDARQNADLAHELAHEILKHPVRPAFDDRGCRNWDPDAEEQANWLGPALLVSDEAALEIARRRLSVQEAALLYGVSEPAMRFRLNVTGAYKRVA